MKEQAGEYSEVGVIQGGVGIPVDGVQDVGAGGGVFRSGVGGIQGGVGILVDGVQDVGAGGGVPRGGSDPEWSWHSWRLSPRCGSRLRSV
jgi:hypothetical protein